MEEIQSQLVAGSYDAEEVKDLLEDIDAWSLLDNYYLIETTYGTLTSP